MTPRVLNKRIHGIPPGAVYVGRPTKFGNPFSISPTCSREQVIKRYALHLRNRPELVEAIKNELRGKDLVCWCAPQACHADILLKIANANEGEQ
jgi:hypothetical protein